MLLSIEEGAKLALSIVGVVTLVAFVLFVMMMLIAGRNERA